MSLVRNSFPCIPGLSPVQLGTLVTALSQLLYLTIIVAVMPRSDIIKSETELLAWFSTLD